MLAVDITGRHPKSLLGNEYIVTVSCLFSRWAEAFAVRNHTASTVAKVLVEQVFCRFGVPKRLLSDLGSEFQGQHFREMCKRLEIDQIRTTAYKPRTNGQVERFHKTLNSMLGKVVSNHHVTGTCVYPTSWRRRHVSTKYTPNMLVLARENRAPADLVIGPVKGEEERYDSYDDYVLQWRFRSAHQLAREHLGTAAERRKEVYDTKDRGVQFKVGRWVWYLVSRKLVGRYLKWTRNYQGPYLVVRTIPPCDYQIQRNRRSMPITLHSDKLKLCYSDTPPAWIQTEVTPSVAVDSSADRRGHEQNHRSLCPGVSVRPAMELDNLDGVMTTNRRS